MTPEQARAAHRRMLVRHGETIIVLVDDLEAEVRARVTGFSPEELTGDIEQGDRKVILLPDGLDEAGVARTLSTSDQLRVRGNLLAIVAVDDNTRRIDGELIAYELVARGA